MSSMKQSLAVCRVRLSQNSSSRKLFPMERIVMRQARSSLVRVFKRMISSSLGVVNSKKSRVVGKVVESLLFFNWLKLFSGFV